MDDLDRRRLETFLVRCRRLVASDKGDEAVTFEHWFKIRSVRVTASGILNVFGSPTDADISTPMRGGLVKVPTVLFYGTKDEILLPPNAQTICANPSNAPSRELV